MTATSYAAHTHHRNEIQAQRLTPGDDAEQLWTVVNKTGELRAVRINYCAQRMESGNQFRTHDSFYSESIDVRHCHHPAAVARSQPVLISIAALATPEVMRKG
ncbi:hypothetical protein GOEFS_004_00360 [Gordonia effusa NBRC 100432]|uniref:Uncharacterized protein n=1 Tax=Gordonia effusa NBRC 100432 TaxID=1077974 RepID=H0QUM0_9ACTN|nr:hypothetical protein GOEFS_004_00360 [Gordonia effusa NBRC 100432]